MEQVRAMPLAVLIGENWQGLPSADPPPQSPPQLAGSGPILEVGGAAVAMKATWAVQGTLKVAVPLNGLP